MESVVSPFKTSGILDVCIHEAKDLQCFPIHQKQQVYAKFYITTNPEKYVTTQTIMRGGRNPVFNETLQLDVPTIDSSLTCEIYTLSRTKSFIEDQLLGFASIPLSEILMKHRELDEEFTLSSTDLFYSPSGFVHLSLSYTGASTEITNISPPPTANGITASDSEIAGFGREVVQQFAENSEVGLGFKL